MSGELSSAVIVAFPLRDEGWVAVNSPADRIPSVESGIPGKADRIRGLGQAGRR